MRKGAAFFFISKKSSFIRGERKRRNDGLYWIREFFQKKKKKERENRERKNLTIQVIYLKLILHFYTMNLLQTFSTYYFILFNLLI